MEKHNITNSQKTITCQTDDDIQQLAAVSEDYKYQISCEGKGSHCGGLSPSPVSLTQW